MDYHACQTTTLDALFSPTLMAVHNETPPTSPPRMSEEIAALLASLPQDAISLREVMATMQGRVHTLLLMILALPFCQPLPLPGLSTFFGTVIALIGLRLCFRLEPWFPAGLLDRKFSPRTLGRILSSTKRLVRALEVMLRPRWSFLVEWTLMHHLYGAMICVSGVFLLLPLPVPLSNTLPALAIVLLAAAMFERDGLVGLLGIIVFALALVFFGGIFLGGAAAIHAVREWFAGIPPGD